jgi:hypothetical protein
VERISDLKVCSLRPLDYRDGRKRVGGGLKIQEPGLNTIGVECGDGSTFSASIHPSHARAVAAHTQI